MRFVLLGAGAVGGIVGGRLARAGCDVVLVARGAHAAAIRAAGLRVDSADESFGVRPAVCERAGDVAWQTGDVGLLAVKTQDADAVLGGVPADVPVACLTNGVAAERIAARRVREVYGACVFMPAKHLVPGIVQTWSSPVPGVVDVGRYPDGVTPLAQALVAALRDAGFASELRADIMREKRGKLLFNLSNAVEVLCGHGSRNSTITERARAEATACFAAAGLAYSLDETPRLTPKPIEGVERGGGSTWQSLARGRPLEVDYLNGEIVELGRAHGVPTPVNAALQRLANAATAPGAMTLAELEAAIAATGG